MLFDRRAETGGIGDAGEGVAFRFDRERKQRERVGENGLERKSGLLGAAHRRQGVRQERIERVGGAGRRVGGVGQARLERRRFGGVGDAFADHRDERVPERRPRGSGFALAHGGLFAASDGFGRLVGFGAGGFGVRLALRGEEGGEDFRRLPAAPLFLEFGVAKRLAERDDGGSGGGEVGARGGVAGPQARGLGERVRGALHGGQAGTRGGDAVRLVLALRRRGEAVERRAEAARRLESGRKRAETLRRARRVAGFERGDRGIEADVRLQRLRRAALRGERRVVARRGFLRLSLPEQGLGLPRDVARGFRAGRRGGQERREGGGRGRRRLPRAAAHRTPRRKRGRGHPEQERRKEEDAVALDAAAFGLGARVALDEVAHVPLVDGTERAGAGRRAGERQVDAAGRLGDGFQGAGVEPRRHLLAAVAEVAAAVVERNGRARRAADADAEDRDARLAAFLRGGERRPGEVFAVGHEQDRVVVAPAAAERGESGGKRAAEIGFAARGGIGARGVERFEEKAGVRRERAERLGVGAEGDEAGAVAVEIAREVR